MGELIKPMQLRIHLHEYPTCHGVSILPTNRFAYTRQVSALCAGEGSYACKTTAHKSRIPAVQVTMGLITEMDQNRQ